ncbi:MAG: hypothetical protein ACJAXR_000517 [Halopseudomonas sp.]|jgi:hypothetical protein|uniref:hypothetical protein n=1 Tax=Halopseudomonas sp. TaxID=2901191 RepID=UPI0039E32BF2
MNKIQLKYVFMFGAFLFIFGLIYGIAFAFPSPDVPSEKVNVSISFWSLSVGVVLIEISIIGGMTRVIFNYLPTSLSVLLTGVFLVASGCIYGVQFVFPLPRPPPDGLLWACHIFASITLFLVGLLLLILFFLKKFMANKALQRTSR